MYRNILSPAFMKPRRITVDIAFERKKERKEPHLAREPYVPDPCHKSQHIIERYDIRGVAYK